MTTARLRTVVALLGGHLLLALAALVWALSAGSSEAQIPVINCPPPSGWAVWIWYGYWPTDDLQKAFDNPCGVGAVDAAYHFDRNTQTWQRWFAHRPEVSNLERLLPDQAVIALGAATAPQPPPEPPRTFFPPESRSPGEAERLRGLLPVLNKPFYIDYPGLSGPDSFTAVPLEPGAVEAAVQWLKENEFDLRLLRIDYLDSSSSELRVGGVHECPPPGAWAMAVWRGYDGTDPEQAFADACGDGAVDAAYHFDRITQTWRRWFAARPDLSNLEALNDGQGVIALGNAIPPQSTPVPTVIPRQPPSSEEAERLRSLLPILNKLFDISSTGPPESHSFIVSLIEPGAVEAAIQWLKDNGFDLRLMSIDYMESSSWNFLDHFSSND